jgi:hypothetical protein
LPGSNPNFPYFGTATTSHLDLCGSAPANDAWTFAVTGVGSDADVGNGWTDSLEIVQGRGNMMLSFDRPDRGGFELTRISGNAGIDDIDFATSQQQIAGEPATVALAGLAALGFLVWKWQCWNWSGAHEVVRVTERHSICVDPFHVILAGLFVGARRREKETPKPEGTT